MAAAEEHRFRTSANGDGFRFTGRGFGHGVGLCVIGAGQRARQGTSADEILSLLLPDHFALAAYPGPSRP